MRYKAIAAAVGSFGSVIKATLPCGFTSSC